MKTYKGKITNDMRGPNNILVFGSNTEGRHGAGMAKIAHDHWGAEYKMALGIQGNAFAICTKDLTKMKHPSISAVTIEHQIKELYAYAYFLEHQNFYVAYTHPSITLCGYTTEELAKMFACEIPPENIIFEENFGKLVEEELKLKHEKTT